MRLVLVLLLMVVAPGAVWAEKDTCGEPEALVIDGGCAVRPGLGALASLVMVLGALAIAQRRATGGRGH